MKKKKNGAMHTILGNKIDYDTYKTSKQVTKEINSVIRPILKANGFKKFSGRTYWRYESDRIDVLNIQSFNSYNEKDSNSRIHAHNPFFNLLLENGITGVFIYLMLILWILTSLIKYQKINYKDYRLAIVVFFISGMFTSISYINSPLIWLVLYLCQTKINYDNRNIGDSRSR